MEFAGERLESIPTVMNVTDWYCPSVFFVLRTEVRQMGKVQRVDVTAFEREEPLGDPAGYAQSRILAKRRNPVQHFALRCGEARRLSRESTRGCGNARIGCLDGLSIR